MNSDNPKQNGKSLSNGIHAKERDPHNNEKGLYEWLIFGAAILTGTACSILSKLLYETRDDKGQKFDKPIVQTLVMFLAMIFGLPIHWLVIYWKIPFPGYDRFRVEPAAAVERTTTSSKNGPKTARIIDWNRTPKAAHNKSTIMHDEEMQELLPSNPKNDKFGDTRIPLKTYFYLFIPAVFDCIATVLCMIGLLFLSVSIYQLLRGSGIIFVALLRQYYLREHLYWFQWTGVGWNVVSVVLVGAAALLDPNQSSQDKGSNLKEAMIGVIFMLAGSLVQSMMFVFEEKVMSLDEVKVPPLLLFGMEGLWGAIITILFLYPIGYYTYGNDHGSFEDPWHTWDMLKSSTSIQVVLALNCLTVFGYNLFAVLVTFSLSSVWHSILDNFRPMTVWITDLIVYYVLTGNAFGEPWTRYSWIQLGGLVVLVYGTMIYNAPDAGSIALHGEWFSLWLNFSDEYDEIHAQRRFSSMGSYPSLQRFLTASVRSHNDCNGRIFMSLREKGSPKLHYGTLSEQHSI